MSTISGQLGNENTQQASTIEQTQRLSALPIGAYLDEAVVPVLLQGLAALTRERPENPVDFLGNFLLKNNPNRRGLVEQSLN